MSKAEWWVGIPERGGSVMGRCVKEEGQTVNLQK